MMYRTKDESLCEKMIVKLKNKIQYFGDESSLQGVRHVFSMSYIPFLKRLFWLIILFSCCMGAAAVLRGALRLYSEDVVSYSVDTNYLSFDTPFPAVTLCEQMDPDRVRVYLEKNKLPIGWSAFFKEAIFWNIKFCRSCTNCKLNSTCIQDFQQYVDDVRLNCSRLLTDCWWDDQPFVCCERFLPLQTEYGRCFSFNSRHTSSSIVRTVNRSVGLPNLVFTAVDPILIRVHAPDDEVSALMESVLGKVNVIPLVSDFDAILKVDQTTSDESVSALSSDQRGCLFSDERPAFAQLWPFKEYTYSACVLYCRAIEQTQRCNCTHHFLPKLHGVPKCNITGMACLFNNKDALKTIDCVCPMACEEVTYKLMHAFFKRHVDRVPEELIRRGTRARIRLAQLPSLRVRRHALRDTLGLVVDIGGVGGVFFGASLLSVIEIVYLFCIRKGP